MVEHIEFANNFDDLSTNQGFQFEFKCNRCANPGTEPNFNPPSPEKLPVH